MHVLRPWKGLIKSALALTTAVLVSATTFGLAALTDAQTSPAFAQDSKPQKPKTKVVDPLRKPAYDALMAAQEAMEARQYQQAMNTLNSALNAKGGLNNYERALIYQTMGYVYAEQDNLRRAGELFEQALGTGGLPEADIDRLTYNLGQIYVQQEQYQKAINHLLNWFRVKADPPGDAYYLLAIAYWQTDRHRDALTNVQKAIEKAPQPVESWYQLLVAAYFQLDQHNNARSSLERMIQMFPGKRQYWEQLGFAYSSLNRDKDFFAVWQMMHLQKMLDKSTDYVTLAQLYLANEVPYKGAKVLEEGFNAGKVAKTKDNYELLGIAWRYAREHSKAIEPLTTAASLSDTGELYYQLGQTYSGDESWKNAEQALVKALNKGGLKDVGNAWYALGYARSEMKNNNGALEAFVNAARFEKSAKGAASWIQFLDQEGKYREVVSQVKLKGYYRPPTKKDTEEDASKKDTKADKGTPAPKAGTPDDKVPDDKADVGEPSAPEDAG